MRAVEDGLIAKQLAGEKKLEKIAAEVEVAEEKAAAK